MDELLPKAILDAAQTILGIAGAMLVIMVVQPLFSIPILLLLVILLYARKIYMSTSQNTRRLESVSKLLAKYFEMMKGKDTNNFHFSAIADIHTHI